MLRTQSHDVARLFGSSFDVRRRFVGRLFAVFADGDRGVIRDRITDDERGVVRINERTVDDERGVVRERIADVFLRERRAFDVDDFAPLRRLLHRRASRRPALHALLASRMRLVQQSPSLRLRFLRRLRRRRDARVSLSRRSRRPRPERRRPSRARRPRHRPDRHRRRRERRRDDDRQPSSAARASIATDRASVVTALDVQRRRRRDVFPEQRRAFTARARHVRDGSRARVARRAGAASIRRRVQHDDADGCYRPSRWSFRFSRSRRIYISDMRVCAFKSCTDYTRQRNHTSRIKPHANPIKIQRGIARARVRRRRRAIAAAHVDDAAPPRRRSTNGSESARARASTRARLDATRRRDARRDATTDRSDAATAREG